MNLNDKEIAEIEKYLKDDISSIIESMSDFIPEKIKKD
jgi:hypothetical protein